MHAPPQKWVPLVPRLAPSHFYTLGSSLQLTRTSGGGTDRKRARARAMATAARRRCRRLLGLALLALMLFAAVAEGGKKGKGKKGKKGKKKGPKQHPVTNEAMPCVACRRMLGHLESSLADAFNKMDAQVMREQVRQSAGAADLRSPARPRSVSTRQNAARRGASARVCVVVSRRRPSPSADTNCATASLRACAGAMRCGGLYVGPRSGQRPRARSSIRP